MTEVQSGFPLDSVESAIAAVKSGRPVVVIDDEDRENEGDLIFASELATPELVAFMVRYTSGYICVAVTEEDADRLDLPPMFRVNQDRRGTAYTVTVDAREGVTTGISASDRAHTIRTLASAESDAADLARPGHIVQGHVDGVGTVVSRTPGDDWEVVRVAVPADLARYVVEKGSIAVDGVSLTVSAVTPADHSEPWFEVSLIPTTLRETTLGARAPGDPVNLEVDVIAKYVERLLEARR